VAHTVFDFPNFFLIRVGQGPTHPLPNFSRNFGIFLFPQDPLQCRDLSLLFPIFVQLCFKTLKIYNLQFLDIYLTWTVPVPSSAVI